MNHSVYSSCVRLVTALVFSVFFLLPVVTEASFNIGSGFGNNVQDLTIQADGKIVVVGNFNSFNGSTTDPDKLIRLNSNGTVDTAFSTNMGTGPDDGLYSVAVQSDGKILAGGDITSFNGSTTDPDKLIRLNSNGTVDTAFSANLGTGFDEYAYVDLQSDDKVLVTGEFASLNGSTTDPDRFVRLNSDGTVDTAFSANLGTGFNNETLGALEQSDGKILVYGGFTSFNGSTTDPDGLIRLNSDGTVDTAFSANLGTGFSFYLYELAVQTDNKILIVGNFTSFNGSTTDPNHLIRLNSDGTVDTAFSANLGTGFGDPPNTLFVQSDNKIVIGGSLSFNGSTTDPNNLIRLNGDGTLDTSFSGSLGTGFDNGVYQIALQSDGKIVVGGNFTTLDGASNATSTPDYLLRLNSDGTIDPDAPPTITILGDDPASVALGGSYTDGGATATDLSDGTLTSSIATSSTVNTGVAGSYDFVYSVIDANEKTAYATRTVNVINNVPTITITGDNPASVTEGETYTDAGATASDVEDGSLTGSINTTNAVDINTVAAYSVVYDVTDSDANIVYATRTVNVIEASGGGGGGGGGGSRGSSADDCEVQVATDDELKVLALSLKNAPTLEKDDVSSYVKTIQEFLNGVGCIITKSGDASPGKEVTKFTFLTRTSLKSFQTKHDLEDIVNYGVFDSLTRNYIISTYGGDTTVSVVTNNTSINSSSGGNISSTYAQTLSTAPDMTIDFEHSSVKTLQQFLNSIGYPVSTTGGPGSVGQETTTFWHGTQAALSKFQSDNGVSPASGNFGPVTRALLQDKYSTYTTSGSNDDALLAQINALLAQIKILQTQLAAMQAGEAATTNFTNPIATYAQTLSTAPDMTIDFEHSSVKTLQQFLNALGYRVNPTGGPGSPDKETSAFGVGTQAALSAFQRDHEIGTASGNFGPLTREVILGRYGY